MPYPRCFENTDGRLPEKAGRMTEKKYGQSNVRPRSEIFFRKKILLVGSLFAQRPAPKIRLALSDSEQARPSANELCFPTQQHFF
jgi:hypothetical protein